MANNKKSKKVSFDESKNTIHYMYVWTYAYRSCRQRYWELFYLDNLRFRDRIKRIKPKLDEILSVEHREKVFQRNH